MKLFGGCQLCHFFDGWVVNDVIREVEGRNRGEGGCGQHDEAAAAAEEPMVVTNLNNGILHKYLRKYSNFQLLSS